MKRTLSTAIILAMCMMAYGVNTSSAFRDPEQVAGLYQSERYPIARPHTTTVRVVFPDSITEFMPGPNALSILRQSTNASIIYISGRTSTVNPSARDEFLAFKRAASARKYLIEHYDVSPLKIMVNYASAADYVADNSTREGRLQNQRVDIEMVHLRH